MIFIQGAITMKKALRQKIPSRKALTRYPLKAFYMALCLGLANSGQAAGADGTFSCRDFKGYRIIDLNENSYQETFVLRSDEDVLFLGPDVPRRKYLRIDGGRNVAVVGGSFAPSYSYNPPAAAIGTKNQSGSIWIEGVSIDNDDSYGSDGIILNAAGDKAIPATIRNTTIVNIKGTEKGRHGDIVQPQGRIGELAITNLIGTTGYQGLFLMRQDGVSYGGKVDRIKLSNVRLEHLPGGDERCLYLISVGGKQDVELDDVYLTRQPHSPYCSGGSMLSKDTAKVIGSPRYDDPEDAAITGASVKAALADFAGVIKAKASTGGGTADTSYRAASNAACD